MFFFWFAKNKQFNQENNLSGQIFPFLLVVLVILLVAAVATINIGRVSLDKTCSANAADAGALAAASAWASAFNVLTEINRDQLEFEFDQNYYTYGQLYLAADKYLDEAITDAAAASAAAIAAAVFASDPPKCVIFWWNGVAASVFDATASWMAFEASTSTQAFSIAAQFMQSLTDSFHEQQWSNYCSARDFMDSSYINARKTGLSYAFSNGCISSKLSDSQNDAFSAWMSAEGPYNDGTYTWQDKIPQPHTVKATLDLPKISSYTLQHTQSNYSQISSLLDGLISRSQIISGVLNSTAVVLGATAVEFMIAVIVSITAFTVYVTCCNVPYPYCCPAWAAICLSLQKAYTALQMQQTWLIASLAAIVGAAAAVSLYLLKSNNDQAFDNWAPDGMQTSTSCADAGDLMIVKINQVTIPSWITTCQNTQQHPGTSSGILATVYPTVTSTSRARFDGGDVGTFNDTYDASIVDTH